MREKTNESRPKHHFFLQKQRVFCHRKRLRNKYHCANNGNRSKNFLFLQEHNVHPLRNADKTLLIARGNRTRTRDTAHYPGGARIGRHRPWGLPTAVRGLASCHIRTRGAWHRAICTHGALPTRITRAARWGHRAAAPSARCAAWSHAHYAHGMAVRPVSGALGVTRRRALRGPGAPAGGRGRTETPPAKLSTCATCHAHGTLRTRGAHAILARALPTATGRCGARVDRRGFHGNAALRHCGKPRLLYHAQTAVPLFRGSLGFFRFRRRV